MYKFFFFFFFFFFLVSHFLGTLILMFLIVISYLLEAYCVCGNFWYGYLIFLFLVSGLMVIFSYMLSINPNDMFEFYGILIWIYIVMWMYMYLYDGMFYLNLDLNYLKFWLGDLGFWIILMLGFLLLVMIIVVEMSCSVCGAVRLN